MAELTPEQINAKLNELWEGEAWPFTFTDEDGCPRDSQPDFYRDLFTALHIVAAVRRRGWAIVLDIQGTEVDCYVGPRPKLHEQWRGSATATEPAEAICRATAAALEAE